jgi:NADPH:quinone reductase-like Zn-dependent oxidoreductase
MRLSAQFASQRSREVDRRRPRRLLLIYGSLAEMLKVPWVALTSRRKIIAGPVGERVHDLAALAAMTSAGELKPVIDRRYPLARIAEAHRYVDGGHKKGNVVVTV